MGNYNGVYLRRRALIRLLFSITLLLVGFIGCQEESEDITPLETDKVILPNSVVADLIGRISLHDGSSDNILDNCSCTSLVLPVTVIANGQQIKINTEDDFLTVEQIFNENNNDVDILVFIFPFAVILTDHAELIIQNQGELQAIINQCTEGGDDDDIECIDFQYPLIFSLYDSDNQLSNTITINGDHELHDLFKAIKAGDLVGLEFPIEVVLPGGSKLVISDNDQLEDAIESERDDCDEDDRRHEEEGAVNSGLIAILTEGEWKVTYFFDETDKTIAFINFVFTFNIDGTASATDGVTTVSGTWESEDDNGSTELKFDFDGPYPWEEIHEDWEPIEVNNTTIKLTHDGQEDTLVFEKV